MQLDSSADGAGSKPQRVPLRPCPGAPFDDDRDPHRKQLLSQLPLQRLHLPANIFAIKIDRKSIQPIVRRKTNRPTLALEQPALQRPRKRSLPRTGQAAHHDQSPSVFAQDLHSGIHSLVALTMPYTIGPSGQLTSGSSSGASTLFHRARVIFRLPNSTSRIRNSTVTHGM